MNARICSLVLLPILLASGCGKSGPDKHPVTGTVLVNGQPAGRVNVCLRHTDESVTGNARNPVAVTDENGRFTLSSDGAGDGTVAGEYMVTFFWMSSNDPNSAYDRFGGAFGDFKTSRYRVKVPVPDGKELEPFRLEIDPKKLIDRRPAAAKKERAD